MHDNDPVICVSPQAVHDYEHKGTTNDFLIACTDQMALTYNDKVNYLNCPDQKETRAVQNHTTTPW